MRRSQVRLIGLPITIFHFPLAELRSPLSPTLFFSILFLFLNRVFRFLPSIRGAIVDFSFNFFSWFVAGSARFFSHSHSPSTSLSHSESFNFFSVCSFCFALNCNFSYWNLSIVDIFVLLPTMKTSTKMVKCDFMKNDGDADSKHKKPFSIDKNTKKREYIRVGCVILFFFMCSVSGQT